MEKKSLLYKIFGLIIFVIPLYSFVFWGFQGHKVVNEKAIYSLPIELFSFYKLNADYIREHSIDPDKRRHSDEDEAPRHYIDIDHFAGPDENPYDVMPRNWDEAVDKFSEDTLLAYGIVTWHVQLVTYRLTEAFKEKDKEEILRLSAELGHYVADACVPLHNTINYDGQLSGQKGIHSFWETRLVELYSQDYNLLGIKAVYIKSIEDYIWTISQESYSNVAPLLLAERKADDSLEEDEKYIIDDVSGFEKLLPSPLFAERFNANMEGMVEARMRRSIEAVSSFWYTAWVNAGQPDLKLLK